MAWHSAGHESCDRLDGMAIMSANLRCGSRPAQRGSDAAAGDEAVRTEPMGPAQRRRSRTAVNERNAQTAGREDVGARVARVAHELKVPVSVISGSLENLERYVGALVRFVRAARAHLADDPVLTPLYDELAMGYVIENAPALVKLCHDGSQQLNHVVEQLRGDARPAAPPRLTHPIDLAAALAGALAMAAASRETVPAVHWTIAEPLTIRGAPESLGQAFINILCNAFDALAEVPEAQVWISGRRTVEAGEWIEIRIADNGPGVAPAVRQRIFDSFFTTKSHGVGLGLGLAISREIIEAHGGSITLADTAVGATFVIRLPAMVSA
jgi:signal transduction histidine kinase